jgi:hypothetical protein
MADRFAADRDSSLGKEIFDISVAEIEAIVEPDRIGNDIWRKPMSFVCVHPPILAISAT